jgi:hypothetical protein
MDAGVVNDKRTGAEPIPANLDRFLNRLQLATLRKIEDFGWHLWFVRRPLFQDVVAVVADSAFTATAILEEDGVMNKRHNLYIRP